MPKIRRLAYKLLYSPECRSQLKETPKWDEIDTRCRTSNKPIWGIANTNKRDTCQRDKESLGFWIQNVNVTLAKTNVAKTNVSVECLSQCSKNECLSQSDCSSRVCVNLRHMLLIYNSNSRMVREESVKECLYTRVSMDKFYFV